MSESLVDLRAVDFDPISLRYFLEHFLFKDVLGLEPVVPLLEAIHTSSLYYTSTKRERLTDSFQHLYLNLCIFLSETSH